MSQHLPPPPGLNMEAEAQVRPESVFRGVSDVERWKKEDWMNKKGLCLVLRALTLLFSFLSFVIVVTVPDFTKWSDLSYLFSIGLTVTIYSAVSIGLKGLEVCTGRVVIPHNIALWTDFLGDQCLALFLLSSASSATSIMRDAEKFQWRFNFKGLGQGKAAAAMAFLAFFPLESVALISGYNFSVHFSTS